jgi:hypothetical protein
LCPYARGQPHKGPAPRQGALAVILRKLLLNMERTIEKIIAIVFICFLFENCSNQLKPRTITWSGSLITFHNAGSSSKGEYYLGYYIELSDTGESRLMTRQMFNSQKEYYNIIIPDSVKENLWELIKDVTIFKEPKYDSTRVYINDDFIYNLEYKNDTIDKQLTLLRFPEANEIQKKFGSIMDIIFSKPIIMNKANFDLKQYEQNTENQIRKIITPLEVLKDESVIDKQ